VTSSKTPIRSQNAREEARDMRGRVAWNGGDTRFESFKLAETVKRGDLTLLKLRDYSRLSLRTKIGSVIMRIEDRSQRRLGKRVRRLAERGE
jgi:hypothetical protein